MTPRIAVAHREGGHVKACFACTPAIVSLRSGVRFPSRDCDPRGRRVLRASLGVRCPLDLEAVLFSREGGNHPAIRAFEGHGFVRLSGELLACAESVRCDDDRQLCDANLAQPGAALELLAQRVPVRLGHQLLVRLVAHRADHVRTAPEANSLRLAYSPAVHEGAPRA